MRSVCAKWLSSLRACVLIGTVLCLPALHAEQKFDVIEVGANTYSNVTVLNKSSTHIFISHSKGVASFGVKELPLELQAELGYEVEPPPKAHKIMSLEEMAQNPELLALQQQWEGEIGQALRQLDPVQLAAIGALLVFLYFFYCYCCLLICRKAGYEPGIWVWVPVFQMIPLFKAARMSAWNFLFVWLPIIGIIISIVWCVKICQARGKSGLLGLFLLLPISNIVVFLYLAFADSPERERSGVIKLQYS